MFEKPIMFRENRELVSEKRKGKKDKEKVKRNNIQAMGRC